MTMNEMQQLLITLMRTIDKGTTLTVEPSRDTNRPGVTVRLARDRKSGTLEVSEASLTAGQTDRMARNELRTALRRAYDRMFHQPGHIFDTKMPAYNKKDGGPWFASGQRSRGRR